MSGQAHSPWVVLTLFTTNSLGMALQFRLQFMLIPCKVASSLQELTTALVRFSSFMILEGASQGRHCPSRERAEVQGLEKVEASALLLPCR